MAEKELETVENPQEVEASQPEKEEKMVSVAEMQRRLKQMEEKHTLEIADMQTGIQAQIEEAVAKAKMSEEELQELQQKQRDKEFEEAQSTIAALQAQIAQRQMQDVAIKELEAQGVPVNESTLAFVVKGDEEATRLAVSNMANILNLQKREEAKALPPRTSGGEEGRSHRGKDKFDKAKITNF